MVQQSKHENLGSYVDRYDRLNFAETLMPRMKLVRQLTDGDVAIPLG